MFCQTQRSWAAENRVRSWGKHRFHLHSAMPLLNRISSTPAVWPTVGSTWLLTAKPQHHQDFKIKLLFRSFGSMLSKSERCILFSQRNSPDFFSHQHLCPSSNSCVSENCWEQHCGYSRNAKEMKVRSQHRVLNNRNWKSCDSCCTF